MTTGMILGKFYPPHTGHQYLIQFASQYVNQLVVIVESVRDEKISAALRASWLQESFPTVQFLCLYDYNPQEPSEDPDFWNIWQKSLNQILPFQPDYLFASESYGVKLAKVLNSNFIPIDPARSIHSISATQIRKNIRANFDYMIKSAQQYFRQRICICGPESTGKTTLTQWLAQEFNCCYVPEYARTFLENCQRELLQSDLLTIAKGQAISEIIIGQQAKELLMVDTGASVSALWSEFLFNQCDKQLADFCQQQEYDLYLLCQPDIPWVKDSVRYLPESSNDFFKKLYDLLPKDKTVVISGDFEQRKNIAKKACIAHLNSQSTL
ncbi:AAA family ATPase [Aliikangiella sp. IMCC44359]|uniref:AAA family ATPase n=1 Tax=Aliikangiella sp. IMCC44359 TaxID=3459125 RepID=UPI00403ADDB2